MRNSLLFSLIFVLLAHNGNGVQFHDTNLEYYWKEYTHGLIPPDALPGGKDLSGRDTYIGQAYIHGQGLYIVQIFPGKKQVEAAWRGVKTATNDIKILCTESPEDFKWIQTSSQLYHFNTTRVQPVPGGYDFVNNDGLFHVGRLAYQGVVKIGGIWSSQIEKADFYFGHDNALKKATVFEALVYRKLVYDIDVRTN